MTQLQMATVRVASIEDLRHVLDGSDSTSVPLGTGAAKGSIIRGKAGDVQFTVGQWSADIRTRGSIRTERISLGVKLDSDSSHFSFRSGREVLPGEVYTLARGDDIDYRVTGPIRYAFVSLAAETLIEQAGEDAQRETVGFWERRHWFCAREPIRTLIARSVQRIARGVLRSDWAVTGQALRQLQYELVEPFLWGFFFDEGISGDRHVLSGAAIVKKVEDWADGQSPETIHIADLCGALHVSRRTLQRAFTETLGMGPARYLTLKRLAAARAELRGSDPTSMTVTDTATKYGFWELGRFAQDYRRVFGESPSETLIGSAKVLARTA